MTSIYRRLYDFYGPQGWWPGQTRLEIIVGAMLTQNTSWRNVEKAILNLKTSSLLLCPRRLRDIDKKALAAIIRPAGYYNVKSTRLKSFIGFLYSRFGGSLKNLSRLRQSDLRRELLGVSGIGPETCDSILLYAFGRPVFVVDAYTKRIFSRHRLLKEEASYDEAQKYFMANLPKDKKLYNEYHALIVRLGKEFCKTRPRCGACPLKDMKSACK